MMNGYYTLCHRCGKQILMVRNIMGGWRACNPLIAHFKEEKHGERYVTPDGDVKFGRRDCAGEFGYKLHSHLI